MQCSKKPVYHYVSLRQNILNSDAVLQISHSVYNSITASVV